MYFRLQVYKLTHGIVTIGHETTPMPGFGSFMFGFGGNSEGFLEELFCLEVSLKRAGETVSKMLAFYFKNHDQSGRCCLNKICFCTYS